ncbi:MAG: YadA C-terminal domain-containing protein [Aeromonadaceae bacterium]
MKKIALLSVVALSIPFSALAAETHDRWQGSVDKFSGVITNQDQFNDVIKYASTDAKLKLMNSFKDGRLTAEEIKASGISDHHFYTGYLSSAKTQGEYDKYLKQMNGGQNMDDYLVSNRDLKAHGSMIMNQVDTKMQVAAGQQAQVDTKQDQRVDKIVEGLKQMEGMTGGTPSEPTPDPRIDKIIEGMKDIGNHLQAQTPSLPDQGGAGYDDTQIKNDVATNTDNIQNNANNIAAMGSAFEQRVDVVNGYLSQAGSAIKNNSDRIDAVENNFNALAQQTAADIARMDGRINELEKKTDRLKAGIAGANAIGSLTQYTGSGTHHVAVGIGGYDGASALAGGYTYAISAQTTVRVTVAYDSEGDFGYGASVGHSW